jgi:hypothetical protein
MVVVSFNRCLSCLYRQKSVRHPPVLILKICVNAEAMLPGLVCTSAKNISIWADWLRQSGRAPSEPSETPRGRNTPHPASILRVQLHITLRSPFSRFFSCCWSPTLNKHSGIVANYDHTSEWVHCIHACIGIAMHKDPRNLAKSE